MAVQHIQNASTMNIIAIEWDMFDRVNNVGGRASCQDDYDTFAVMRASQFDAWSEEIRQSYLQDLNDATESGRNLLTEKYAYMSGHPYLGDTAEFNEKKGLIADVTCKMVDDTEIMRQLYPKLAGRGRPLRIKDEGWTSVELYLMCEIMTYSKTTLELLNTYLFDLHVDRKSLPIMILENTVKMMGYPDLETAEAKA